MRINREVQLIYSSHKPSTHRIESITSSVTLTLPATASPRSSEKHYTAPQLNRKASRKFPHSRPSTTYWTFDRAELGGTMSEKALFEQELKELVAWQKVSTT